MNYVNEIDLQDCCSQRRSCVAAAARPSRSGRVHCGRLRRRPGRTTGGGDDDPAPRIGLAETGRQRVPASHLERDLALAVAQQADDPLVRIDPTTPVVPTVERIKVPGERYPHGNDLVAAAQNSLAREALPGTHAIAALRWRAGQRPRRPSSLED